MTRLAGRYELHSRLAEGGMAEVWLATSHGEAGFTRRVAIKQLFPREVDGGSFERMFLDEARITSRLHHAGIVSILDFGVEAGRPFQVLELVDGFDISRLARWGREQGKPLPPGLALYVCSIVGQALQFAHVALDDAGAPLNIVHRDVSPQNVLVSRSGDVKLSDFGIAFAEGRLEKTVGGVARGKPAYMAPEQAVRGAMDGRTDVFALGCVLHALVTGESALRDENALVDLLSGVELTLEASLPGEVREVIAQATRRNKAERYDSAEAMALACAGLVPKFLESDARSALATWVRSVAPEKTREVGTPTPVLVSAPKKKQRVWWPVGLGVTGLVGVAAWVGVPREVPAPVAVVEQPAVVAPPALVPAAAEVSVPDAGLALVKKRARPLSDLPPSSPPQGLSPGGGEGVLSLGGEAFLRGEVFIDGVSRGFAPARFELEVGPHRVEIVSRGGQKFGPRELIISRQHTASSPLSWEE